MGRNDFTFVNNSPEEISFSHSVKNTTMETFSLPPHVGQKKIKLNDPSVSYEKYWLLDSTGLKTVHYVSADDFQGSKQVIVTKEGDEFKLTYVPRFKWPTWQGVVQAVKKFNSKGNNPGTTSRDSSDHSGPEV